MLISLVLDSREFSGLLRSSRLGLELRSSRIGLELCLCCVCVCDVTVGFLKWISSNLSGANFVADFLAYLSALCSTLSRTYMFCL
jgi:hypothetical protein